MFCVQQEGCTRLSSKWTSMAIFLLHIIRAYYLSISKFHLHWFSDAKAVDLEPDFLYICYGSRKSLSINIWQMTLAAKDGVHEFSQWRLAAEDSQPSQRGEQWQPWELREKKEKLEYRDCQQQRRSHHAGYGGEEQCRAGSQSTDGQWFGQLLLTHHLEDIPMVGVETTDDGWTWLTTSLDLAENSLF